VEPTNAYNPRLRELPSSERPRERLRDLGAGALSNGELLAIILRTGSAKQSVLTLAGSLLARHGGLGGLARLSFADLKREQGLGEAKTSELQAVFELARRLRELNPEDRVIVRTPRDVFNLLGQELSVLDQEHLKVILLNSRNQLLHVHEVYVGNVSSAVVRSGEVLREAVRRNAPSVVLVHNHPSGDPAPSADDVKVTKHVLEAAAHLDIEVLDHIIIGDRRYLSLKQLDLAFPPER